MATRRAPRFHFLLALGLAILTSIALFAYGAYRNRSLEYDYLLWNLFLAGVPLLFARRLTTVLHKKVWSAWEPILLSLLWLLFLPNSFYMISDFIHLRDIASSAILYDAVMFTSFIYLGVLLGFSSLYLVHLEFKKRLQPVTAAILIGFTLLICSFAIYIGRDLRWNSWDVIFNPGGLLFDISDRVLRPEAYPSMFRIIVSFFVLLSSLYTLAWQGSRLLRQHGAHELAELARARALASRRQPPLV